MIKVRKQVRGKRLIIFLGDLVYDKDLELVGVVLDTMHKGQLVWVQFAYKLQTEWCYRSTLEVLCK